MFLDQTRQNVKKRRKRLQIQRFAIFRPASEFPKLTTEMNKDKVNKRYVHQHRAGWNQCKYYAFAVLITSLIATHWLQATCSVERRPVPKDSQPQSVFNLTATTNMQPAVQQTGPSQNASATSVSDLKVEALRAAIPVRVNSLGQPANKTSATTTTTISTTTTTSAISYEDTPTSSDLLNRQTTASTASVSTTLADSELDDNSNESDQSDSGDQSSRRLSRVLMEAANEASDGIVSRARVASAERESESDFQPETEMETDAGPESPGEETAINDHPASIDWVNNAQPNKRMQSQINQAPVPPMLSPDEEADRRQLQLAMETYAKWRSAGDDFIELFSRKMLPLVVEHGYEVDAGTVSGLLQVFNGIRALKPWALKLIDASAKLAPGILLGTQSDFGDYDECLNVRVDDPSGLGGGTSEQVDPATGLSSSTVVGRYCLADIEFPKPPRKRRAKFNADLNTTLAPIELRKTLLNFADSPDYKDTIFVETGNFFHMLYVDPLRVGICLTNKIEPHHFSEVFNKLFRDFNVAINFNNRCVTKYDRVEWTIQQRISAYIILSALCLIALSTTIEILHMKMVKLPLETCLGSSKPSRKRFQAKMSKVMPILSSFSLIRNTKRLFKAPHHTSAVLNDNQQNQEQQLTPKLSPQRSRQAALGSSQSSSSGSSVESSPSIERRSSSIASSDLQLIEPSMDTSGASRPTRTDPASLSKQTRSDMTANLSALHGIRVITMIWMIVNHTYMFGGFFVLWAHRRLIDISEWPKSLSFQLVLNGWLTVETYFFLSATIVVLTVLPLMKSRRFAYFPYVIHRLLRLMPAYVGLICLNFLWPLASSGPVWLVKGRSFIQWPCENYLWANFLFVSNWIWPEKQCMVHTWFLSADFQLYLLAPILVYLFHRRPFLGHTLNVIVAIAASLLSGFVIYANELLPTTLINKLEFDSIKQQLSYSYFATYQHVGPYSLGLFVGFLLNRRPQVSLPRHLTWLLWILLPPLSFTTLLLTYLWNGAFSEPQLLNPSPLVSALYVAIHRTIWTSLIAWIVFACGTGKARFLSSFLSHFVFVPLSRLSFSIYLVHMPLIMFRALNLRHTVEWTDLNILWEACGNFIGSILLGYFLNVAFESPVINLEHALWARARPSSEQHNQRLRNQAIAASSGKQSSSFESESSTSSSSSLSVERKTFQAQLGPSKQQRVGATQICDTQTSDELASYAPTSNLDQTSGQLNSVGQSQFGGNKSSDDEPDRQAIEAAAKAAQAMIQPRQELWRDLSRKSSSGNLIRLQRDIYSPQEVAIGRRYLMPEFGSAQQVARQPIDLESHRSDETWFPGRTGGSGLREFQQPVSWRHLQNPSQLAPERGPQYATLARTSRFNHAAHQTEGSPSLNPGRHMMTDSSEDSSESRLRPSALRIISSAIDLERDDGMPSSRFAAPRLQQQQQSQHYSSRRKGRYNTLSSSGAREWRNQSEYLEALDAARRLDYWRHLSGRAEQSTREQNWPQIAAGSLRRPRIQLVHEETEREEPQIDTSWLPTIPRINSSTLRRQSNSSLAAAAAPSIAEEPHCEEVKDNANNL